jgi:hypothetical protein
MDFLSERNVELNLKKLQLTLLKSLKFKQGSVGHRIWQARGKSNQGTLTFFVNKTVDIVAKNPSAKPRGEGTRKQM